MQPLKVAVFHPGTQHSWQTARALQDLGRLEWYATSILYQPDRWPYRLERLPAPIGPKLHAEFARFAAPALDPRLVRASGGIEWLERIALRLGHPRLARRLDRIGNDRFGRALDRDIAGRGDFALWGYDSSARAAFECARRRGRFCILDRTIGHRRALNRVMADLRHYWPDWFTAASAPETEQAIAEDEAEFALADAVVVGSAAAAASIRAESAVPGIADKLHVLPYCFDDALFGAQPPPAPSDPAMPVRFLLVGRIEPRKGIHLLLEAIMRLPAEQASLTLVGGLLIPPATFARYADRVRHVPHVPRAAIPALMAAHDVLVFPSYFEGSALSLLEALASGLAIIQSAEAGNGVTPDCGSILVEQSVDALVDAMQVPIADRDLLDRWRRAAQAEAANYTLSRYRDRIAALIGALGL